MANIKITDLDALTAVDGADLVEVVDDVAGTATSKKMTHKNLLLYNQYKGGDIASASPLVVDTDGNYFDVTGTTGFAAMTVAANRFFVLQFDGALTMTHHATNLDLPGEKNITTAAGDIGVFFSTGANTVQCISYTKADGTPVAMVGQNLLTNSGFGVWSNSGDMYTTAGTVPASGDGYTHDTETCDDDAGDDESSDWSETGGGAIAYVANTHYTFTGSAADEYVHSAADFTALTAGKLYELKFTFADAAAAQTIQMGVFTTGAAAFTALGPDITTTGSEVAHTRVFEADGTERRIGFKVTSDCSAPNNILWTDSLLHEVTPGCVAADALAFDGWEKTSTLDLHRQHTHATYTKDGSFYSLKTTKGADGAEYVWWGKNIHDLAEHYLKFDGRTVTIGAWVYSVTATDNVKLGIYENGSWTVSSSHAGADAWEWMELPVTVTNGTTDFRAGILLDGDTSDVAYISQPMLVFGSSIGEGNYQPSQDKWVGCEDNITLTDFSADTFSDVASITTINLEAQSNGKIPKGIQAVLVGLSIRDSDISTGSPYFAVFGLQEDRSYVRINLESTGAERDDVWTFDNGIAYCDANGDISYQCLASGTDTLDVTLEIIAVKLR